MNSIIFSCLGKNGTDGKGGLGGSGFINADAILTETKRLWHGHLHLRTEQFDKDPGETIPSGANGSDGANRNGIKDTEKGLDFYSSSIYFFIGNESKKCVRELLVESVRGLDLLYLRPKV